MCKKTVAYVTIHHSNNAGSTLTFCELEDINLVQVKKMCLRYCCERFLHVR